MIIKKEQNSIINIIQKLKKQKKFISTDKLIIINLRLYII